MEALIFKPANKEDADLLINLANKMKVKYTVLSEEDKEDYALANAMLAAKNSKVVSEVIIMKKLKG